MCLHQDAGCLGVAVPDRSYERRLTILKEFGVNAIRCSHNPPSPEFLDYCDSIGFWSLTRLSTNGNPDTMSNFR